LDQVVPVNVADLALLSTQWNMGLIDGLIAHWMLDDAVGLVARDNYAHHHGILTNMTEYNWVPGILNNALAFDGIDDYVQMTGYKGVTGTTSRTCMAWIKTTTPSSQILSWGSLLTGEKWMFRVNEDGTLRAEVQGGYIYGTTPVADGNWHHVAVVLADDGSPNINEAVLYVDGVPETSLGGVSACPVNTAALGDVRIGVNVPGTIFFQGLIDEVRIYNKALSEQEILTLSQ
jgi:hypothetical protein